MPELLDPHLEQMVKPLMAIARRCMAASSVDAGADADARSQYALTAPLCHRVFRVIYTLAKVRGYKTVGASPRAFRRTVLFDSGF
jgi:hypothetical protein